MGYWEKHVEEGEVYRISGLTAGVFYAKNDQEYYEAVEYFRSRGAGYSVQRINIEEFVE